MNIRQLHVNGMHCQGCEDIICDALAALPGMHRVLASYVKGRVDIEYDPALLTEARIAQCLADNGYSLASGSTLMSSTLMRLLLFLLLLALVGGVAFWGKSLMPGVMQQIKPQMDMALLLGIGFLTGFHCIGMCGGFLVAYTDPDSSKTRKLLAHLRYALGKTLSYTALGAGFGLLGAAIAITPQMRGGLALAASLFLLIYGLKMLNLFGFLRRFSLQMPKSVTQAVAGQLRQPKRSALRTGLLTGLLLGCGPLQAMYVMAAGTGDPIQGGMILLLFGLGTLGPLLSFGMFASLLPQSAMRQLVRVSGILLIAMAAMMAQRGMLLLKGGSMPVMGAQSMQQEH